MQAALNFIVPVRARRDGLLALCVPPSEQFKLESIDLQEIGGTVGTVKECHEGNMSTTGARGVVQISQCCSLQLPK